MIVDSMWAEPLDSTEVLRLFRVIGGEHLDVGDRGSMVVLPHFGNWDIAASASLGLGLHLSTVMAPVVSPGITEMVALSRQRKGLEIFTPRQAARGLFRALRKRRTVALMLDIPEAGPTVVVPFCGGLVRCSAVPARTRRHHRVADPARDLPSRRAWLGARDSRGCRPSGTTRR